MKEEHEEGEKAEKVGKNCWDGEVLHLIALQGEMELEFTKNPKKQGKFQTNIVTLASIGMFSLIFVFFHSRLEPTTLIKAQNVSKFNLLRCRNIFSEKLPKVDSSYVQLPSHTLNSWWHVHKL
jgi:hypothetical protein